MKIIFLGAKNSSMLHTPSLKLLKEVLFNIGQRTIEKRFGTHNSAKSSLTYKHPHDKQRLLCYQRDRIIFNVLRWRDPQHDEMVDETLIF